MTADAGLRTYNQGNASQLMISTELLPRTDTSSAESNVEAIMCDAN